MTVCTCTDFPVTARCICRVTDEACAALDAARGAWRNPTAARLWLHAYSQRLGGIPVDLLLAGGRGDEVVAESHRAATESAGAVT